MDKKLLDMALVREMRSRWVAKDCSDVAQEQGCINLTLYSRMSRPSRRI